VGEALRGNRHFVPGKRKIEKIMLSREGLEGRLKSSSGETGKGKRSRNTYSESLLERQARHIRPSLPVRETDVLSFW